MREPLPEGELGGAKSSTLPSLHIVRGARAWLRRDPWAQRFTAHIQTHTAQSRGMTLSFVLVVGRG